MIEVIGIDHIYIAVTDMARSTAFYDRVFRVLGYRSNRFTLNGDPHVQYYNRHFGYVLRPAKQKGAVPADMVDRAGLHHFCFRVHSADDVETAAKELNSAGIAASPARLYPEYAPDYVATFFADPDGLKLEITNYRAERRERHDHWQ